MKLDGTNSKLYRGRHTADGGMEWQEIEQCTEAPPSVWEVRSLLAFVCLLLFGGGCAWGYLAAELLLNLHR